MESDVEPLCSKTSHRSARSHRDVIQADRGSAGIRIKKAKSKLNFCQKRIISRIAAGPREQLRPPHSVGEQEKTIAAVQRQEAYAQPVGECMGHPPRQCLRRPSQDFGEAKRVGALPRANLLLQSLQEIDMGLCNSKPSVAGSPARYATPPQSRPRHLSRRRHRAGIRLLLRPVHCARLYLPHRVAPLLSNRRAHPVGKGQDGPAMKVLAVGQNTWATCMTQPMSGRAYRPASIRSLLPICGLSPPGTLMPALTLAQLLRTIRHSKNGRKSECTSPPLPCNTMVRTRDSSRLSRIFS